MPHGGNVGRVTVDVELEWAKERRKLQRELKSIEKHYRAHPIQIDVELNLKNPSKQIAAVRKQMQEQIGKVTAAVNADLDRASAQRVKEQLDRIVDGVDADIRPDINRAQVKKAKETLERELSPVEAAAHVDVSRASVKAAHAKLESMLRSVDANVKLDSKKALAEAAALHAALGRILGNNIDVDLNTRNVADSLSKAAGEADFSVEPHFKPGSLDGLKRQFQKVMPGQPMWVWPQVNWARWRSDWNKLKKTWTSETGGFGKKLGNILQKTAYGDVFSKTANLFSVATRGQESDLKSLLHSAQKTYWAIGNEGEGAAKRIARGFKKTLKSTFDVKTLPNRGKLLFKASWEWEKSAYKAYQQLGIQKFMRWKLQVKTEAAMHALVKFAAYAKKTLIGAFVFGGASMLVTEVLNLVGDLKNAVKAMAPALGAVAGAFAAFAAGAGVAVVALKDYKEQLGDLEGPLQDLQSQISSGFWAQARVPVLENMSMLIRELTPQVNELATVMGGVAAHFATGLGKSVESIRAIVQNASAGFVPFQNAIELATQALLNMLAAGSTFFPRFTSWLEDVSGRWLAWTQSTDLVAWMEAGVQAVKDFMAVVTNLFGILGDVATAAAAGGVGMRGFADRLIEIREIIASPVIQEGMAAFFEGSRNGANALGSSVGALIAQIAELGDYFGPLVEHVGEAMASLVDVVGGAFANPVVISAIDTLVSAFDQLVQAAGPAFSSFIAALMPQLGRLGDLFIAMAPTLGDVASLFADIAGTVFENVADLAVAFLPPLLDAVQAILPHFQDLTNALLPVLVSLAAELAEPLAEFAKTLLPPILDAITALLPSLEVIAEKAIGPIAEIIAELAPYIADMVVALLPVAVDLIEGIVNGIEPTLEILRFIVPIVGKVVTFLGTVLQHLSPVIKLVGEFVGMNIGFGLIGKSFGLIKTAGGKAFEIIKKILSPFKELGGAGEKFHQLWLKIDDFIANVYVNVGEFLGGIKQKVVDWFAERAAGLGEKLAGVWESVSTWFADLGGKIGEKLGEIAGKFKDWFAERAAGLGERTAEAGNTVKNWFTGLPSKIWGWLKETATKLKTFMSERLSGLTSKLGEGLTKVKDWFTSMPGKIGDWFRDIITKLKTKGSEAMQAMKDGVLEKWESLREWFSGLGERIRTTIGDVISKLKQKGKDFLEGLRNGITEKWESVSSWLRDVPTKVKNAIGTVTSTLWNAGRDLMNGLLNGLTGGKWTEIQNFVSGIATWIKNHKGPLSYDRKLLEPAGEAIMQGLYDSLKSEFSNVQNLVSNMASRIRSGFGYDPITVPVSTTLGTAGAGFSAALAASVNSEAAYRQNQYVINMNLEGKDLRDVRSISDFVDMAKVKSRMNMGAGHFVA